jgi:hypothetical protein
MPDYHQKHIIVEKENVDIVINSDLKKSQKIDFLMHNMEKLMWFFFFF